MISKIDLKCFQINLMLELFICLRLDLLELFIKKLALGITFFFSNFDFNFLASCLLFSFA
jgi:hypothetical protein